MYRTKPWTAFFTGSLALFVGFLVCADPIVTLAQHYSPPKRGIPKRREGAGTRGTCLTGSKYLMPLQPADNFGATASAQPTFFWYVPPKSPMAPPSAAKSAAFRLLDESDNELYSTTFPLSGLSGVVSFKLPASKALALGKVYNWQLSIICDPDQPSYNPFVEGTIQRTELPPDLIHRLDNAPPRDRAALYASEGFWYDSLSTLANLRCSSPRDYALNLNWATLLGSVELTEFSGESLSQYCSQISNEPMAPARTGVNPVNLVQPVP